MKERVLKWNEQLNRTLYKALKVKSENKLNFAKKGIEKYLKKMLKELKIEKKYSLSQILEIYENELEKLYEAENEYKKSEKFKELDFKTQEKKLRKKFKLGIRSLQGTVYSSFLKKIVNNESDYYIWYTMQDSRVREKHEALEGKLLKFSTSQIIPGEEINCRCYASIVLPSNEKEVSRLEKQVIKYEVKHKNDYKK